MSAQVGIGTTTPHPSAQLDVTSDNKGVLFPRMPAKDREALNGTEGLLVYQTDPPSGFYYYTNSQWVRLTNSDDRKGQPTIWLNQPDAVVFWIRQAQNYSHIFWWPTYFTLDNDYFQVEDYRVLRILQSGTYEISFGLGLRRDIDPDYPLNASIMVNGQRADYEDFNLVGTRTSFSSVRVMKLEKGTTLALEVFWWMPAPGDYQYQTAAGGLSYLKVVKVD